MCLFYNVFSQRELYIGDNAAVAWADEKLGLLCRRLLKSAGMTRPQPALCCPRTSLSPSLPPPEYPHILSSPRHWQPQPQGSAADWRELHAGP